MFKMDQRFKINLPLTEFKKNSINRLNIIKMFCYYRILYKIF